MYYYIIAGLVVLAIIAGFYIHNEKIKAKELKAKLEADKRKLETLQAKKLEQERVKSLEKDLKSYENVLTSMSPSRKSKETYKKPISKSSDSDMDPMLSLYIASEVLGYNDETSDSSSKNSYESSAPSRSSDDYDRSSSYSSSYGGSSSSSGSSGSSSSYDSGSSSSSDSGSSSSSSSSD